MQDGLLSDELDRGEREKTLLTGGLQPELAELEDSCRFKAELAEL